MLVGLEVRDVVLIERLDLAFQDGLCVLTGETGAGKSILLDSLGLALGGRADSGLLRAGAERASVTAVFEPPPGHPVWSLLDELEIELEPADASLVLRRTLGGDGRSRAYLNDRAVSVGLLRQVGDSLVEIQGQFEQRGLLDVARHRALLDAYGSLAGQTAEVERLWRDWRAAEARLAENEHALAAARHDEELLRHAVEELDALAPETGEEAALAERRQVLLHREQLIEALNGAVAALAGDPTGVAVAGGAQDALGQARRRLDRVADKAGDRLEGILAALGRAEAELDDALLEIQSLSADIESDGDNLQAVEERYFALRDLARKHGCAVDELPALAEGLRERLARVERGDADLAELRKAALSAAERYRKAATALSAARRAAAGQLDEAVMVELPALRLDKAVFRTLVEPQPEEQWSAEGLDRVVFEVATNPGSPPGPLHRIASGGELARFLLALKVVLAAINPGQTLVFDEVDSGIGGATAHAVGERLARLAERRQVLVVTHSPQVAARAHHHLRVAKVATEAGAATAVDALAAGDRREEIARMLAGAEVTDEARAAAQRLMSA